VGFTAGFAYSDGEWERDELPLTSEGDVELGLMIHDSDRALVMYQPVGSGSGEAILGPSSFGHFGLDDDLMPTHEADEALGLAEWWASRRGGAGYDELNAKRAEIGQLLTHDPAGDSDTFIEPKVVRLLQALDIPLPDELSAPQGSPAHLLEREPTRRVRDDRQIRPPKSR
jgi:hypothetical protein